MVAQLLSASQVDLDTATAVLASCDWNLSVRSPTRGVDTCGAGCNTWLDVRFRLPWTSSPQAVAPRSNQLRVETSAGGARAVVMLVLPARRHLGRLPVVMMGAWARVCIRLRWLGCSADMLSGWIGGRMGEGSGISCLQHPLLPHPGGRDALSRDD